MLFAQQEIFRRQEQQRRQEEQIRQQKHQEYNQKEEQRRQKTAQRWIQDNKRKNQSQNTKRISIEALRVHDQQRRYRQQQEQKQKELEEELRRQEHLSSNEKDQHNNEINIYYIHFALDKATYTYDIRDYNWEQTLGRAETEVINEFLKPIHNRLRFFKGPENCILRALALILCIPILLFYLLWGWISNCFRLRDRFSSGGIDRWTNDYIQRTSDQWISKGLLWRADDMYAGIELYVLDFSQTVSQDLPNEDEPQQEQEGEAEAINNPDREEQHAQHQLEYVAIPIKPKYKNDAQSEEINLKLN